MKLLTLLTLCLLSNAPSVFSWGAWGNWGSWGETASTSTTTIAPSKCSTIECEMIRNIFVNNLNKQANPCEDPVSFVCTEDKFNFTDQSVPKTYDLLLPSTLGFNDTVLHYLNETVSSNQTYLRSLKIERILFQQCMEFGSDLEKTAADIKTIIDAWDVVNKTINNATWQTIDEELNTLDSEHAFYDIKVTRNPLNPDQNIIMLQPPTVLTLIKKYFFSIQYDSIGESSSTFFKVKEIIEANFRFNEKAKIEELKDKKSDEIIDFFQYFVGTVAGLSINKTSNITVKEFTELPNLIMTINEWNETYNLNGTIPETASIDWLKVFNREFQTTGLDVNGTELIFIKNKSYFEGLADILSFRNSTTLKAAVTIIHGVRTIVHKFVKLSRDFPEFGEQQQKTARKETCFLDTPLYGVSYQILRSWENDEIRAGQQRVILQNVVDSMKSFINKSKISNVKKEFYFKRIHDLTSYFFENTWNASYISNYYENYNLTDNYLTNLINYQRMLKRKELSALRSNPDNVSKNVPFSIHNWDNLRDQIVLYAQIHYDKIYGATLGYLPKFPVEFHYGVYGTKIANYLLKALNDDKLNNGISMEMLYPLPYTAMKYKTEIIDCFDLNHSNNYSENKVEIENLELSSIMQSLVKGMVNQLQAYLVETYFKNCYRVDDAIEYYGISIAYEAMQNSRKNSKNDVEKDQLIQEVGLTSKQMFFLSYFKTRCTAGNLKSRLAITSYLSKEILGAYQCQPKLDVSKCKSFFEIESIFHIHDNTTVHQSASTPLPTSVNK